MKETIIISKNLNYKQKPTRKGEKYQARLKIFNKDYFLGYYEDKETAIKVTNEAGEIARKVMGRFEKDMVRLKNKYV